MLMSIQVPNIQAAAELEDAILLYQLDLQRQLSALAGNRSAYAVHRRALLQERYMLAQAWQQSIIQQAAAMRP